jgi:hypothetical protein
METTDRASSTALSILGGIAFIVAMMLLWGVFFYRGYGEEGRNQPMSVVMILSAWAWGTMAAFLLARYLRGYEWVAGIVVLVAGFPTIMLTVLAIASAACAGHWGSHSCLFS